MSLPINPLFKVILIFSFLATLNTAQNICTNCVDVNWNNFTCNNLGCNGFMLTPSQNSSLNFNTINCLNQGNCYFTSQTPVASSAYVVYLFCNYTFPGCLSCINAATCSQCQNGYFPNVYNEELELLNCQQCSEFIGGCEQCQISNQCQQCSPEYLNIFGFCYTQGGSIVGDTKKPWNKFGSTATQIISAIEIIIITLIIFFVIYKFCCAYVPKGNGHKAITNPNEASTTRRNY